MTQSFNPIDLLGEVSARGIARPSRFMVDLDVPPALLNYPQQNGELLLEGAPSVRLWCESASLPGVALDYYAVRRYGYGAVENKPFAPKFTDANLRLRLDGQGLVYSFMHAWARVAVNYDFAATISSATGVVPNQHTYELAYKEDYARDVRITQFDDAGEPIVAVILRDAFPVYVGDVPLSWASVSEYSQLPVTLTYIGWYFEAAQSSSAMNSSASST